MSGMKFSTIKSLIRNRVDAWIASIKDEDLVKLVRRDTIVSGGCIASALTGSKINDYDLYFATRETALAIANYYVKIFNDANPVVTEPGVKSYQPSVQEKPVRNIKGVEEDRIVIYMKSSGVAAEDQESYDYFESSTEGATQVFMDSLEKSMPDVDTESFSVSDAELAAAKISTKESYRPVFLSENAITLSNKVQLVVRFYGEPEELHANYDFAHAMCFYRYRTDELNCPAEAMEAMLSKTLIYRGSLYPVASLFRIRKFIERGWRISAGQMLKIIFQLNDVDLKDPAILREQLLGVDQAYMQQLMRAIENRDTGTRIDATYLAGLIDVIFEG